MYIFIAQRRRSFYLSSYNKLSKGVAVIYFQPLGLQFVFEIQGTSFLSSSCFVLQPNDIFSEIL